MFQGQACEANGQQCEQNQQNNDNAYPQTRANFGNGQQQERCGYDQPQDISCPAVQIGHEERAQSSVVVIQPGTTIVMCTNQQQSDLVWPAILVCLHSFYHWPLGCCAVFQAVQAQQAMERGDMEVAKRRHRLAKFSIALTFFLGVTYFFGVYVYYRDYHKLWTFAPAGPRAERAEYFVPRHNI